MSRPPDEDPPNTRVEHLFDANDLRRTDPPPRGLPPPAGDASFLGPEEDTRPDLRSPIPQRPTVKLTPEQQAEIERQVYAHEHKRLAEALELIARTLPTLATKGDLAQLREESRGGIGMAIAAGNAAAEVAGKVAGAVERLRSDLQLWLFGDTHRNGIAQEVGFTRVRVDSLFPMVEKLARAQEHHAPNGNGLEHEGQPDDRQGTQD